MLNPMINPKKILNSFLCSSNVKLPLSNSHYITGKYIYFFSNLACVENTLSSFTNNMKYYLNLFTKKYK